MAEINEMETDTKPVIKTKTKARYFDEKKEIEVIQVDDKSQLQGRPKFNNKHGINIKKESDQLRKVKKEKELEIPIDPVAKARHSRGTGMEFKGIKTKFHKIKLKRNELNIDFAAEEAANAEILLNENDGYLEADDGEETAEITQDEIVKHVDITSASKHFELHLDFGPYRTRYTRNGRCLLIGGKRGHVASFDWVTKKLLCEMNVMEDVFDVTWLMNEQMYAVAQKNWVHVYDRKGTELHCIKNFYRPIRIEYLPYHFLLNCVSDQGFLSWIDVSVGTVVAKYFSKLGRVSLMCQNPTNGVTCLGDSKGVVSMWAPSVRDPLAKMLCHPMPLTAIAVDPKGIQMVTSAMDNKIRIWDIRNLEGPISEYKINCAASGIDLSQKGLMAISMGNVTEIYRRPSEEQTDVKPYLRQKTHGTVSNIRFCPYEDVLGIATAKGFVSILVPGSGEPNFDTYEADPYQTKSQRREHEIQSLLEKIPMEFISLDPTQIGEVDVPSLKEKVEAKKNILYLKPSELDFEPRHRTRRKKATVFKRKQIMKEGMTKEFAKTIKGAKDAILEEIQRDSEPTEDFIPLETSTEPKSVLDRFKPKTKKKKK